MTGARLLKAWLFRKFDGEINQPLLAPIDLAEIEAGRDLADLIANSVREERGLRVVEDDGLLRRFGPCALYIRPSIALTSERSSSGRPDATTEYCSSAIILFGAFGRDWSMR